MIKPHHKKIAIIGCAGSGKTTLAFKLKEKLNLPLYHLDQYYWKPGWQRAALEEFIIIHQELCERDEWIMEGSYTSTLLTRVAYADIVIFLDVPRYKCLWYVLKRSVLNLGKIIPGNPEGCEQRLLSLQFLEFLKWIWAFKYRARGAILNILEICKDSDDAKQIYILKSLDESELLFKEKK